METPNVDKLYECGSVLSSAKAADFAKVSRFKWLFRNESPWFFSSMKTSTKSF